jgi:response regulator RpfG family c-di-GMP phosphodiesterase
MTPAAASYIVFAVDDEPDNLELFRRTLHDTCTLHTFMSPEAALDAARKVTPDLFLLDYRMPNTNGVQFLRELRNHSIDCGVIVVTGFPDDPELRKVVESREAFWIIPKPCSPGNLVTQVSMALRLASVRKKMREPR